MEGSRLGNQAQSFLWPMSSLAGYPGHSRVVNDEPQTHFRNWGLLGSRKGNTKKEEGRRLVRSHHGCFGCSRHERTLPEHPGPRGSKPTSWARGKSIAAGAPSLGCAVLSFLPQSRTNGKLLVFSMPQFSPTSNGENKSTWCLKGHTVTVQCVVAILASDTVLTTRGSQG